MSDPDHGLQLHPPVVQLEQRQPSPSPLASDASATSGPSASRNATAKSAPPPVSSTGAIPMSLPSILRNPQLKHLNGVPRAPSSSSRLAAGSVGAGASRPPRDLSKRKARRADNARLAGNPHVVRPTAADFRLQANPRLSTFPASAYSRTGSGSKTTSLPIPQYGSTRATEPCYDASSASSGQFRMSLREARRLLSERINVDRERYGTEGDGPVERTVWKAEAEIKAWLDETVFVSPDVKQRGVGRVLVDEHYAVVADSDDADAQRPSVEEAQIVELQRTANALVWSIPDPFLRLAVHCLARIFGCPSFSKDAGPSQGPGRHTWILNPNPLARGSRRPRRRGGAGLGDRRRSDSVSTAASSNVLGGPGLGAQATRAVQLAGGMETPPTTDLDSRDGGSVRAWNPDDDDTDDTGSLSSSAISVDQHLLAGGGTATILEETTGSELSGSEAEEARQVERRVRRWARHSDVHAHRLATPLEGSENESDGGPPGIRPHDEEVGDVTVKPRSAQATGDAADEESEDWEQILVPLRGDATDDSANHDAKSRDGDGAASLHSGGDSDWAADHEDGGESDLDADVASLAGSVSALDVDDAARRL